MELRSKQNIEDEILNPSREQKYIQQYVRISQCMPGELRCHIFSCEVDIREKETE